MTNCQHQWEKAWDDPDFDAARGRPPQEFCIHCQGVREVDSDVQLIRELVEALEMEIGLHPYEADVPTSVLRARDKGRARLP